MNQKNNSLKGEIISKATTISSFFIPIFQYVPCTAIWFGIMSVPLLSYVILFFQYPYIITADFQFLIRSPGFYVIMIGVLLYIYSLTYQIINKRSLLQNGPYRIIRHPQYISFILMTLGMTLTTFETSPIFEFNLNNFDPHLVIFLYWIGQVLAYILLAKIEEIALTKKFETEFKFYKKNVGFMFPRLLKIRKSMNSNIKKINGQK